MSKLVNINKLKKHFKKGITPLLCSLTIFNLCGIHVNASSVVSFPFPEPLVDDFNGYLVVSRDDGYFHLIWFSFNPIHEDHGANTQVVTPSLRTSVRYDSSTGDVHFNFTSLFNGHLSVYHWSSYSQSVSYVFYEFLNQGVTYGTDVRIVGTLDSIYAKGNFINNNFGGVATPSDIYFTWGSDSSLYSLIDKINNTLWSVNNNLGSKLNVSNNTLQDIYERLGSLLDQQPDNSITDVPSSGITNVTNKEQDLLNKNDSVSNDINNLQVDINPNAASVTWDLLNTAVMSNSKVFTMFISILTIGIIGLILNR